MFYFLLIIIAGLIFYALVERRHKILIGKVIVVIGLLALLGVLGLYLYETLSHQARRERDSQATVYFVDMRKIGGKKSELTVKICNRRDKRLIKTEFYISGYENGCSTAHEIEAASHYGESTRLGTDIIVEGKSCQKMTWAGEFNIFDSYIVSIVIPTWEKE